MRTQDWTPSQLAVARLARRRLLRTADVLELSGMEKKTLMTWFHRELLADPAAGRPGNAREYDLGTAASIVMARYVVERSSLTRSVEDSLRLGRWLAGYCESAWLRCAGELDEATKASESEPDPAGALERLLERAGSGRPDFVVISASGVKRATPEATLGDVLVTVREPFFTVLDMRPGQIQFFLPVAVRLLRRMGEDETVQEVKGLKRSIN
jgi:hypothetical protein